MGKKLKCDLDFWMSLEVTDSWKWDEKRMRDQVIDSTHSTHAWKSDTILKVAEI